MIPVSATLPDPFLPYPSARPKDPSACPGWINTGTFSRTTPFAVNLTVSPSNCILPLRLFSRPKASASFGEMVR
ncbi:hypothetical protein D3C86_2133720 [compost metagenome]